MPALGWGTNKPPALLSLSPRFKRFQNPAVTLERSLDERNQPNSFAVAGKVPKSGPGLRSTVLTPSTRSPRDFSFIDWAVIDIAQDLKKTDSAGHLVLRKKKYSYCTTSCVSQGKQESQRTACAGNTEERKLPPLPNALFAGCEP